MRNRVEISLTEFVDFVAKKGSAKLRQVSKIINQRSVDYEPFMDFYKKIREGIVEFHKGNRSKNELKAILENLKDDKKVKVYPAIVEGYIRFLGRKEIKWFDPPQSKWIRENLQIAINPELGLRFKNKDHVIKLYFKKDPIDKQDADLILTLMKESLSINTLENPRITLLDVPRKKLFIADSIKIELTPLLEGEALNFVTIWNKLLSKAA